MRAFGTYVVRVADPGLFLREVVGTDGEFTKDEITFQIRNIIVQEFSRCWRNRGSRCSTWRPTPAIWASSWPRDRSPVAAYGLSIPEFYIENISVPPEVEAALDKRTSMGIVGDLSKYTQFSAAEAMTEPGGAASGAMAAGVGAGMGMAMGAQMARQGPWGAAPGAAVPPPPPVEHVWHIAEGGQTKGPFSKASMGRMASDGSITRDSWVWTQGQDGWKRAEETELAQLFTVLPPPPPGA
jgi:membrane protease subunit (stomatin/prohibitin family)